MTRDRGQRGRFGSSGDDVPRRRFDAFVAETTDALYRFGYFTTGDAAEAEDLVQETFIRVAAHWGRVRSPERRLAYARKVLFNLALDGARRRTRRREELYPAERALEQWPDHSGDRKLGGVDDGAVQIPKSLGIDQTSPQFLAAAKTCQPLLKGSAPGAANA